MMKKSDKNTDTIGLIIALLILAGFIIFVGKALSVEHDEVARIIKYCQQYERVERGYTLLDDRVYNYVDSCLQHEDKVCVIDSLLRAWKEDCGGE